MISKNTEQKNILLNAINTNDSLLDVDCIHFSHSDLRNLRLKYLDCEIDIEAFIEGITHSLANYELNLWDICQIRRIISLKNNNYNIRTYLERNVELPKEIKSLCKKTSTDELI